MRKRFFAVILVIIAGIVVFFATQRKEEIRKEETRYLSDGVTLSTADSVTVCNVEDAIAVASSNVKLLVGSPAGSGSYGYNIVTPEVFGTLEGDTVTLRILYKDSVHYAYTKVVVNPCTAKLTYSPKANEVVEPVGQYAPIESSTMGDEAPVTREEFSGTQEFEATHEGEKASTGDWVESSVLPVQEVVEVEIPQQEEPVVTYAEQQAQRVEEYAKENGGEFIPSVEACKILDLEYSVELNMCV